MDRAENIKKYLDQEKEGKAAVWEDVSMSYSDEAHFNQCFYLCPWDSVGSAPFTPGAYRFAVHFYSPVHSYS